jgi:signal transduction histidine kinase
MNPLRLIRSHFGVKIFITNLIVTLVGILVLVTGVRLITPEAFSRRLDVLTEVVQNKIMDPLQTVEANLLSYFQAGVTDALIVALAAAFIVAVIVSLLVSQQVVAPVQEMMVASQRIADGNYAERVRVPGNIRTGDLDELAQLALSFNQMAARLESTENIRRQLIADVAHELRTPLTTIKGSMEGLLDGVLPADANTYQLILHEAERLQRLVDDLQELSRVEAGAYELHRQAANVVDLVDSGLARLDRQSEEKGVGFRAEIPADLSQVWVDEDRIVQVFINLFANALQYSPAGSEVTITASNMGKEVEIAIADRGIGISADQLGIIFDRFYRVDKSRSRSLGGSGIGLTIAKHLVEAHSGRIWAESAGIGQGSTFYITLPTV